MTGHTVTPFQTMLPLSEDVVNDPAAMEDIVRYSVLEWPQRCREAGGEPLGDNISVEIIDNVQFGLTFTGPGGEPILDALGEPLRDHVKAFLITRGRAIKPPMEPPNDDY